MIRFKQILCATDFSKCSHRAADYAVELARRYEAPVHFLHIMPEILMHPSLHPYIEEPVLVHPEVRSLASHHLEAFVGTTGSEDIKVRHSVVEGTPAASILRAADVDKVDLICVGTHGREGFDRFVLGSVAEKVLRRARCPVLSVSEPGETDSVHPPPFKRIVCAIDFAPSSLRALEYALSLAQEAEATLLVMNVLEWFLDDSGWQAKVSVPEYREKIEQEARRHLEDFVPEDARNWCDVETQTASGKAYRQILRVADEREADLIVMGVRGRNPLDVLIFGSTVQQVARHASCPVLTVSGKKNEDS